MRRRRVIVPWLGCVLWLTNLTVGAGEETLPLPDAMERLTAFRLAAIEDPQKAFEQFADEAGVKRMAELGRTLAPRAEIRHSWSFFFGTSLAAVTSLDEQSALVLFYNPWGDVAWVSRWTASAGGAVLTDAELVTGDLLRRTPLAAQPTPLWRRDASVPPPLTVAVAAGDSSRAFLSRFGEKNDTSGSAWRARLFGEMSEAQKKKDREAVGTLWEQALFGIHLFFEDDALAELRATMGGVRDALAQGRVQEVLTLTPDTLPETRRLLLTTPVQWKEGTLVALATSERHAFVFLASYQHPADGFCFWFDMHDEKLKKPVLRRIDYLSHRLSFTELDGWARKAGMRRPNDKEK
jgi:hypothetical protein